MARPVERRADYDEEAVHLMRLRRAVELDKRRSAKWRARVGELIGDLLIAFARVPRGNGKARA